LKRNLANKVYQAVTTIPAYALAVLLASSNPAYSQESPEIPNPEYTLTEDLQILVIRAMLRIAIAWFDIEEFQHSLIERPYLHEYLDLFENDTNLYTAYAIYWALQRDFSITLAPIDIFALVVLIDKNNSLQVSGKDYTASREEFLWYYSSEEVWPAMEWILDRFWL